METIGITDWFPPGIKPVRAGWYKRRFKRSPTGSTFFNYWGGEHWYYSLHGNPSDRATKKCGGCADECDNMEWCGLAKEPK